jgi:hypothetical protein
VSNEEIAKYAKRFRRGLLMWHEVQMALGDATEAAIGTYQEYLSTYPGGRDQRLKDIADHLLTDSNEPSRVVLLELHCLAHGS